MSSLRSRHKCSKCDKYFSTNFALSQHIKNHVDETEISDEEEDEFAKTEVELKTPKFPCTVPHCGAKLGSKTALQAHIKSVHVATRNFKCSICSNANFFRNLRDLNVHKKKVHGAKKFKCAQCPRAFTMSCSLKSHVDVVHSTERDFECTICGKKFKQKSTLKSHVDSVHSETLTLSECDICKKFYKTAYAMKSHKQNVHQNGEYKCDLCPKTFTRRDTMSRHKNMAHLTPSGSSVKCSFPKCGKVFVFDSSMKAHYRRVHVGGCVKKFPCYFCDKMFESPGNVVDHTRSHTGERPFKCAVCKKEFSTLGLLTRHEPTHVPTTERKQFKCPLCSRRSFYSFDLKNHMRKMHGSSKSKIISGSKPGQSVAVHVTTHMKKKIFKDEKKIRSKENKKVRLGQKRTLGRSDAILDTNVSKGFVPTTPNSDKFSPLPYIKIETETLRETDETDDGMDIVHSIFVGGSDTVSEQGESMAK
ncbi:zinc finger protein 728 [Folsomia candida]|uniref:zinc finger protein 728 n=1 Tax=Folsomia candida TaxID=158441 RepID=UPI000B8F72CB|nr:zinc finger protein 728 [Folsomia candida]XP_021965840.1 zinc finger protein 728 [Folsomia candida]XP_035716777.1 zinc finger protein 728 [Folsomia candida]XP_035716778.1 zinc finger protein 728 [Folsomia candida]